jgi:hypothetical protein
MCAVLPAQGAAIAEWEFPVNPLDSKVADSQDANLAGDVELTRGPDANATGGAGFRTQSFKNLGISVENTCYYQVTLEADAGYAVSLSGINASFNGTGTYSPAPGVEHQWAYSLDGVNFTLIGDSQFLIIGTTARKSDTFDFSGVAALQEVQAGTTITLRYYASGRTATGGWGFSPDGFSVEGEVGLGGPPVLRVSLDQADGFEVIEGNSLVVTATVINGEEPYTFDWDTDLDAAYYTADDDEFTILDSAPLGDYYLEVLVTDDEDETADASVNFSVVEMPETDGLALRAGVPVTEDFDSIGDSATATLPEFWKADKLTTVRVVGTWADALDACDQAGSKIGGTASAGIYNYGATTPATDRAVGFLSSGSGTKSGNLYAQLVNKDSTAIEEIEISYSVEKYRDGKNPSGYQIQLFYSYDGENWTSAGEDFLTTFDADEENVGYDDAPDVTVHVSGTLTLETPLGVGANLYLAWNYSVQATTTTTNAQGLGIDDVEIVVAGEAELSVSFDKADNFSIEQGESATITATAKGGEAPYWYLWGTSLLEHWDPSGNQFTIRPTAPVGDYEATVYVTDNAETEIEKVIHFSITAPAPKYAITVSAGANGSATTSPDTQAAAGVEVTINPQANIGYVVDAVTVTAADSSNVPVSNNKFTMPAQAVTVAVSFKDAPAASDVFIDFESGTLPTTYVTTTDIELEDGKNWTPLRLFRGNGATDRKNGAIALRMYPTTATNSSMTQSEAYDADITAISFWVASFGSDTMAGVALDVDVSADGSTWTTVETLSGAADIPSDLTEVVIEEIPAGMTYIRFFATAGAASNKRINIDDITVSFGPAGPKPLSVAFDKEDGFKVNEGSSAVITATASGGTGPYDYTWSSSLGAAYYSASGNQFTVLGTAAVGSYWAKVEVEDDAAGAVDKTINFTVSEPSAEPDAFIDFESGTLPGAYAEATSKLEDGKEWKHERVVKGNLDGDKKNDSLSARLGPMTGSDGHLTLTEPYDDDISAISFWLARYGTDNMNTVELTVDVSSDGVNWTTVETFNQTADFADALTEIVLDEIPAGMTYLRFYVTATSGSNNKRINIDDIAISFGPSGPKPLSVSFDKTAGFTVQEGASAVITATASGGEAPYTSYDWSTDLPAADYSASGNVFTIKASAALGDYWAKVVVTDSADDTANKTINFSVVDVPLNVAILPIAEEHTTSNAWAGMTGWSGTAGGYADGRAKFDKANQWLMVNFDSAPDTLSFDIKGNTATGGEAPMEFLVEESTDGVIWSEVDTIGENQVSTSYAPFGPYDLNEHSRFVRWTYVTKFAFNLGLNNVVITKGEGGGPGPGVEIVVTGALTGTVDEELVLGIELLEAVAEDWALELTDPDNVELTNYGWDGETLSFTPTLVGTYTLEIEAVDEGWNTIATKTVYLEISEAGPAPDFPIESIVYVPANGTLDFDIPEGATATVYGASEVVDGDWDWVELTEGIDYTISGNTISIKTTGGVPAARMIRIGK